MMAYRRRPILYTFLALCAFGLFALPHSYFRSLYHPAQPTADDLASQNSLFEAAPPSIPAPTGPRISVIVIWSGGYRPYLNNFFTSFRANNDTVELIWVDVGNWKDDAEANCLDITPWTGPSEGSNIKSVCLSQRDYWTLHRDYFCSRWGCTETESQLVLQTMMNRSKGDRIKSWFRLWRGYVFQHLMHPSSQWWGWSDTDTFMGNFRSQFPWAATEYDVLIPSLPDSLLYLRGHLCFFRTGSATEDKLNQYGTISNMNAYLGNHSPFWATEEAEFSAFIFRSPSITFLTLPYALINVPLHLYLPNTAKFCTLQGVFTMQNPIERKTLPAPFPNFPVLSIPVSEADNRPTMFGTDDDDDNQSSISTGPVELTEGTRNGRTVWFPLEYATEYEPDSRPEGTMRYVGRGGPFAGGLHGAWERIEPRKTTVVARGMHDPSVEVPLYEGLYAHFYNEKYDASWFDNLPLEPLKPYETLVTYFEYGAEIWDQRTGNVTWREAGRPFP